MPSRCCSQDEPVGDSSGVNEGIPPDDKTVGFSFKNPHDGNTRWGNS